MIRVSVNQSDVRSNNIGGTYTNGNANSCWLFLISLHRLMAVHSELSNLFSPTRPEIPNEPFQSCQSPSVFPFVNDFECGVPRSLSLTSAFPLPRPGVYRPAGFPTPFQQSSKRPPYHLPGLRLNSVVPQRTCYFLRMCHKFSRSATLKFYAVT